MTQVTITFSLENTRKGRKMNITNEGAKTADAQEEEVAMAEALVRFLEAAMPMAYRAAGFNVERKEAAQ